MGLLSRCRQVTIVQQQQYNVAHILTAPPDHPDTQGQGTIDRIAWHCEMEIVAPLPRLFPAGEGVQVMASAVVRNGRGESRTNTSMLLLQKNRKWCRSIWCRFPRGFPSSRQMSSELGWFCPTGNGGKCRCRQQLARASSPYVSTTSNGFHCWGPKPGHSQVVGQLYIFEDFF